VKLEIYLHPNFLEVRTDSATGAVSFKLIIQEAKTKGTATEQDAPKPALPVSSKPNGAKFLYQKFDQALCQAVTDGKVPGKATENGVLVKHGDAFAYWREEFKRPPSQIKRYFHKLKHTRIEA
jgi:hypothetical protein